MSRPHATLASRLAAEGPRCPSNGRGARRRRLGTLAAAIALVATGPPIALSIDAATCSRTSVGLVPLTDLGTNQYRGHTGGLYPSGSNTMPASHLNAGLAEAALVTPRNASGAADPDGAIVMLSIGMSHTTQEFAAFVPLANANRKKNPRLVLVDGAQSGVTANDWANPNGAAWSTALSRVRSAGATAAQVQVAWVKVALAQPTAAFPNDATALKNQLASIARNLKLHFPHVRLAYYSSRIYAGYASVTLDPEPFAYQSGFAVKWLIEDQINGAGNLNFNAANGAVTAPWLAWGPYLWADGLVPRSDGLTYACSDFQADGTHPDAGARNKVAQALFDFVKTDRTARLWFLLPGLAAPTGVRVKVP